MITSAFRLEGGKTRRSCSADLLSPSSLQVVVDAVTRTAALAPGTAVRSGEETKVVLTTKERGTNLIGTEPSFKRSVCFYSFSMSWLQLRSQQPKTHNFPVENSDFWIQSFATKNLRAPGQTFFLVPSCIRKKGGGKMTRTVDWPLYILFSGVFKPLKTNHTVHYNIPKASIFLCSTTSVSNLGVIN